MFNVKVLRREGGASLVSGAGGVRKDERFEVVGFVSGYLVVCFLFCTLIAVRCASFRHCFSFVPIYCSCYLQSIYSSSARRCATESVRQAHAYHLRGRSHIIPRGSIFCLWSFCGRILVPRRIFCVLSLVLGSLRSLFSLDTSLTMPSLSSSFARGALVIGLIGTVFPTTFCKRLT